MVLLQEEINKHIKWPRSWYNNLKEGFIVYRLTVKLGFGRQTAYPQQQQPKKKKKKERKEKREKVNKVHWKTHFLGDHW